MRRICLLTALSLLPIHARTWKDPRSRTFEGDFVSRDAKSVTIRRSNGQMVSLQLEKLHADDQKWLNSQHPLAPTVRPPAAADPNAVFDSLCLGDSRQTVTEKLKASQAVELTIDETFIARLGLNGSYQTRKDIGGLRCLLFFDWSDTGTLSELSLQTKPLPATAYATRLKDCWTQLIQLLTTLHGKPLQHADYPDPTNLTDGMFLATHLWRIEGGGSILLGTAMENGTYTTVVRFTLQDIAPVRTR